MVFQANELISVVVIEPCKTFESSGVHIGFLGTIFPNRAVWKTISFSFVVIILVFSNCS
jgi:hypothetical protein